MKLKRKDLLSLSNGIALMEGRQFNVKFSYFIAKNKVALRDEMEAINEARKPNDGFKEFDAQRAKLAQEHSDKNDDGSSKIQDNSFVITALADVFQEKLKVLREKYAAPIKEYEGQMQQFNELLDDEVEFTGTMVDLKDIPPTIEPAILEVLILADLITDEE
jgi:hypothetical protein